MADKHIVVEGDASKVPVRLAPGPKDGAPRRPDGGTQLVFGGDAPQSTWDLLARLVGDGGEVQYTLVSSAALAKLQKKGQKPGSAPPKKKPAEKKKEEEAPAPPQEEVHPAAVGDLFIRGAEFKSKDAHGKEQPARVWAHPDAKGAKRPLVVYLHGIHRPLIGGKTKAPYPQLQDHIEVKHLVHVGLLAKKLIDDGKVEPLIIAAPTYENDAGGKDMVLWNGFDLAAFIADVRKVVSDHGVEIDDQRVAVVGHSGAGCLGSGGMLRLARDGAKFGGQPLRLFGLADTCITSGALDILGPAQKKFDPHTILYCMHQEWGGAGQKASYQGAILGPTLGAKHELPGKSPRPGESDLVVEERWEDVEDGGDAKRISIKLVKASIFNMDHVWRATSAAIHHEGMWPHYAVTLHFVWAALPRFFPGSGRPNPGGEERAGAQPPADADHGRVPAGPPPWNAPASPRSNPAAPFAPAGSGRFWPVRTKSVYGRAVSFVGEDGQEHGAGKAPHPAAHREFLARHEGDGGDWYNSGVELYADYGDPVVASEPSVIVGFEAFWGELHRVLLRSASGAVIGYAGLEEDSLDRLGLKIGAHLEAGQPVGTVGQVESGQAMLMFETYVSGTTSGAAVRDPAAGATGKLLDPTQALIALARMGQ